MVHMMEFPIMPVLVFLLCFLATLGVEASDAPTEEWSCEEGGCGEHHNVWTATACRAKNFGWDSFVCACSGSSCDLNTPAHYPEEGSTDYTAVTSNKAEHRFHVTQGTAASQPAEGNLLIRVNPDMRYQSMLGFGGAFTDAAGLNIFKLSPATQDSLFKSYFAPEGLSYNMGRIPIAGCDFSTRPYSYDDVEGDVELDHFALAEDDLEYKIPAVLRARAERGAGSELLLLASPWSPPKWMKTNSEFNGSGSLLPEMRQPYANYISKFIAAYAERGVALWGLTTQNEPLCGTMADWPFNACVWLAEDMRDWITDNLGPTLKAEGNNHLKLIISDQVRTHLMDYVSKILEKQEANRYVAGIGVHWYTDNSSNIDVLTRAHAMFPDKFLLYTEACLGFDSPPDQRVKLGDWGRAESYAASIIQTVNHYSSGWVDWNIALDMEGGPNWSNNFVDAPVIIDTVSDTFYKQPVFYAMGHFSRFVERGARLVYNSLLRSESEHIAAATFVTEDNRLVAVILNTADEERSVSLEPGTSSGIFYNLHLPARSIQTVLFRVQ